MKPRLGELWRWAEASLVLATYGDFVVVKMDLVGFRKRSVFERSMEKEGLVRRWEYWRHQPLWALQRDVLSRTWPAPSLLLNPSLTLHHINQRTKIRANAKSSRKHRTHS